MDGRRFDGLARILSGDTDRRGALRALAAVVVAGGSGATAAAKASRAWHCSSKADCRQRIDDRCMRARCRRGKCSFVAIRCAGGSHCCRNGRCCENDPTPACASDDDCASSDPCVRSHCSAGHCISLVVDCVPGYACCESGKCCPVP